MFVAISHQVVVRVNRSGWAIPRQHELMPHCSPHHTGAAHPYNQSFYFIYIFKVYYLMEEIEVVIRCHLNKDAMHMYVPGTDTKSDINTGYLGPYCFFTWISTRATMYQG